MNKNLFRYSLFSFFIDPLFYASSVISVVFTSLMFFLVNRFFVVDSASSDLLTFFNAMGQIAILSVPLLVFRINRFIRDDSLPVSPFTRFFSLSLSTFCAASVSAVLLFSVPVIVSFYGTLDFGQVFCGYMGFFCYLFCSVTFTVFLFSAVSGGQGALPLFISVICLFIFNFSHFIPLYIKTGEWTSYVLQKLSFAWHFDSAAKGMIDSRDLAFYLLAVFVCLCLASLSEYLRTGKKVSKLTSSLLILTVIFTSVAANRLYFRADLSRYKQFSVSRTSRQLTSNLENPLRITYFQSKELKKYYPQCKDVVEYLKAFAQTSDKISLSLEKADGEKLSRLGIQGQQIKSENSTKLEYTMVYSAILLQYLDKSTIIPFVLSTQTLEYDLSQRIQQLITNQERRVFVVPGNGRAIENDYSYLMPWLTERGFMVQELPLEKITLLLENLTPQALSSSQLVVLGSSALKIHHSMAIKNAVENGMSAVFMTNPYSAALEEDWNVTKNKSDTLIPVLNGWGFAFDYSMVQDLSNFPLTMQTGEGNQTQYQTINYPLWLSILPQQEAYEGVTVFWASPLLCYGNTKPLLATTPMAWKQNPSQNEKEPFIINPFLTPKTARDADQQNQQLTVASINMDSNLKAAVISDQFFVSSLMTGYISGEKQLDLRNFDYLTAILLELKGDSQMAKLMQNSRVSKKLYKVSNCSDQQLIFMRNTVLIIEFAVLPAMILIFALTVFLLRRRANREKKNS